MNLRPYLFLLVVLCGTVGRADSLVNIGAVSFTDKVVNRKPGKKFTDSVSRSELRGRRKLYFWFTVIGGTKAIEHLDANGELQIQVEFEIDGRVMTPIQVGIKPSDWEEEADELRAQVEDHNTFAFRTFLFTRQIEASHISAFIRSTSGDMVTPLGQDTAFYKPTIQILP